VRLTSSERARASEEAGRGATTYFATDPTAIRLSVSAVVWRDGPGGELLLMQRADNGHWGLPGGYVERGESVAAAAAREVLEETGAEVAVERLVGVYSDPSRQVIAYPDGRRVHAINLCFEARFLAQRAPTTPHEALAAGFFHAGALPSPLVPIHEIRIRDALSGEVATKVR
jgi:ADP-ribose pyrophosphatase YjhB (NUDIX family)